MKNTILTNRLFICNPYCIKKYFYCIGTDPPARIMSDLGLPNAYDPPTPDIAIAIEENNDAIAIEENNDAIAIEENIDDNASFHSSQFSSSESSESSGMYVDSSQGEITPRARTRAEDHAEIEAELRREIHATHSKTTATFNTKNLMKAKQDVDRNLKRDEIVAEKRGIGAFMTSLLPSKDFRAMKKVERAEKRASKVRDAERAEKRASEVSDDGY